MNVGPGFRAASTEIKLILGSKRERWKPPHLQNRAESDRLFVTQLCHRSQSDTFGSFDGEPELSRRLCRSTVINSVVLQFPECLIKHLRRAVGSLGVEACCCRYINVSGSFCCCEVCHLICSTNKDNLLASVFCREYCLQPLVFCVLIDIWLEARR